MLNIFTWEKLFDPERGETSLSFEMCLNDSQACPAFCSVLLKEAGAQTPSIK